LSNIANIYEALLAIIENLAPANFENIPSKFSRPIVIDMITKIAKI